MGLLNLGALYLSWMLAMCLTGLQYSVRGRVSLVATYLFLLVHTPAELNAFDLYLLTRKVAQLCKKDWRDCKFVFPGFWLQVWLIGDGILASGGFLNDIDHYYLYSGKGEWGGALLQAEKIRFCSLPCKEGGLYYSRQRWTAMEMWKELACNGLGHRCESGAMLTFL